jgi:hypothetical protein
LLAVAIVTLVAQLLLVRPRLIRRTNAVLAGQDAPGSHAHYAYVTLEGAQGDRLARRRSSAAHCHVVISFAPGLPSPCMVGEIWGAGWSSHNASGCGSDGFEVLAEGQDTVCAEHVADPLLELGHQLLGNGDHFMPEIRTY